MNVVDWLLDSDPAIRWQAMRDLTDAPPDLVVAERSNVATQGWGARLLALQQPEGDWGGDPSNPEWNTLLALVQLRDMGLDPQGDQARRAVTPVRDDITWHWWDNRPFFHGEVEPCINGRVLAVGAYFGQDAGGLVERLLGEQMDDGGWNCEQENGSTRGSFHSTINVLEGLLEHERATGGSAEVAEARLRGQEYLLRRRMFRRLSNGEIIDPEFTRFSFPRGYRYDVLRGLDYLRDAQAEPDERMAEAIELVEHKRDGDGRWILEDSHPGELDFDMGEEQGRASRWNTLRAMRVLRRFW
jgi:hypothetical protein